MAIAPKFAGLIAPFANAPGAAHTLELYLDYVCPFSKKMFDTVYSTVAPLTEKEYKSKLRIVFRPIVQPWHPSSTLVHEAAVAVLQTSPDQFWQFSNELFKEQNAFFDANTVSESRNETYRRLAALGARIGLDEKALYGQLEVSDKPDKDGGCNVGNKTTANLKQLIKAQRLVGVHVSPTVLFNGLVENGIASSFDEGQWVKWLKDNVV